MQAPSTFSTVLYAGAIFLFGSCAGSFGHQPVVCRERTPLAPGRTYYYVIREESRTLSDEKGEKVIRENGVALSVHCTAEAGVTTAGYARPDDVAASAVNRARSAGADDRGTRLRIVCDTLSLHEHSDGHELNMDAVSALDSPDPAVRMLAALRGAELSARINEQGELSPLSGLQAVYHQMQDLGQDPDENYSSQRLAWERRLDSGFFTSLLDKGWHIYPDAGSPGLADAASGGATGMTGVSSPAAPGLAIGDSWILPDTLDADHTIPLRTTYTLERSRNGILHFATRAVVDIDERNLEQTYRNGKITLRGRQIGFIDVDAVTGRVLEAKSTLRAEGELQMGDTRIPLVIDSTYTMTERGA